MGLIDELNALKERATSDIRHLQDFHVFTGHSYDRYDKMVAAEHPTDSVTNVRTGNTFDAKQIAELLLKYLDEDLPRVVVYQLVSHFEAFRSDLVKLLRQQNPRALNQRRQIIFAEPDMARLAELKATRDIIDGLFDGAGNCIFLFDLTSPNLDFFNGLIFPESDIVVGGWINPNYFLQCLGSANIIGVTWTFSDVDMNGDNYRDRLYVEQFYNPAFAWTTTDAVYLDFGAPIDIETIAAHENGHAHGLGHFGGPIKRQPFKLKPNLRVFNPEAVMNPFYLGGEERTPLPTDVAGLETLYARGQ